MQPIRLRQLEPQFMKRVDDCSWTDVEELKEADGIHFLCPLCLANNGGDRVGVHGVICWAPSVPQTTSPTPGRWAMLGSGLDDLTLQAGSSSIFLNQTCQANFFIRGGLVTQA